MEPRIKCYCRAGHRALVVAGVCDATGDHDAYDLVAFQAVGPEAFGFQASVAYLVVDLVVCLVDLAEDLQ